jgi:hypothetical protein
MKIPARVITYLARGEVLERHAMAKFDNVKFPGDAQERRWPNRDADAPGPKRPATPKSKKERPASKGRVYKGKTRN